MRKHIFTFFFYPSLLRKFLYEMMTPPRLAPFQESFYMKQWHRRVLSPPLSQTCEAHNTLAWDPYVCEGVSHQVVLSSRPASLHPKNRDKTRPLLVLVSILSCNSPNQLLKVFLQILTSSILQDGGNEKFLSALVRNCWPLSLVTRNQHHCCCLQHGRCTRVGPGIDPCSSDPFLLLLLHSLFLPVIEQLLD